MWSPNIQQLLQNIVEKFASCIAVAPSTAKRAISVPGINRLLDDVVRVD